LEPAGRIPPQLGLLEAHGQSACVTKALDDSRDLPSPLSQIDGPVQDERARGVVDRLDDLVRDGAKREGFAERAVVVHPLDVHLRGEPFSPQRSVFHVQRVALQRGVPGCG
jgi:hypothetical protein